MALDAQNETRPPQTSVGKLVTGCDNLGWGGVHRGQAIAELPGQRIIQPAYSPELNPRSLQQQVASGHQRDDDNGILRPVEDSSPNVSWKKSVERLKASSIHLSLLSVMRWMTF
jgi:hypothetical protein